MANNGRTHLVFDVEAPLPLPTGAPQLPSDAIESEKGDPATPPPPYAYPPPLQRTTPLAYSVPPKRRSSCFCCCMCFLFSLFLLLLLLLILLLFLLAVTIVLVLIFFLFFHPQIPKYYVNSVRIPHFDRATDASLVTTFDVNFTASNPNKKIGIYYEGGNHVSVWYTDTELCRGSLQTFYQGHQNTTVMQASLTGNATSLVKAVQVEKLRTGSKPLVIKGTVPVRVKVWKVKLMKIKFKVKCGIDVDSLSAGLHENSISRSSCKIRPHF
ncbi:hypothetical protein Nepgr_012089 [Nepenthes gracilis]|uniref:Late embryogenesis abundant protein LEA-2 subgroup domain-containing protein n=1 Tax=Nepenthes gracilis TaxID=150966 RepID=A0AAD3SFB9_NEPGR|nr:hypothetical protein Nepgr_012089 [Nepenthes gracilis]